MAGLCAGIFAGAFAVILAGALAGAFAGIFAVIFAGAFAGSVAGLTAGRLPAAWGVARIALFTADRWLIKDFFCTDMTSSVKLNLIFQPASFIDLLCPVRLGYKQGWGQTSRVGASGEIINQFRKLDL
ncbi:MAG: hypothetical protein ACRD23_14670 [Terriglobales bacterium]